ncbi:MAG: RND family transporter [Thermoplasmatales archaeon]|nr:RND family transporter [Thermoplasmatales archaeon]
MDRFGKKVSKYPKATIAIVVVITMIAMISMQIFGSEQEFSEESFMPDMEISQASDAISADFTTTASVSILVKSRSNDVLTSNNLVEMLQIENAIITNPDIISALNIPEMPSVNVISVADIIAQMALLQQDIINPTMEQKIFAIQSMNDNQIKLLINGILSSDETPIEVKGMFSMMLTKDFNLADDEAKAKGTMIIISLNPSIVGGSTGMYSSGESGLSKIEKRMDEIVKNTELEFTEMTVMGSSIIMDEIMDAATESMAILLPLAFTLVIIILAIIYRSGIDMLFSLLALVFSIIWVYGFGSAMGYSFNPMTTAVPILIVGLGIDYGIHITMRYREEMKSSKKINQAIIITIASVGMALLLATVTTVVSFLSNLASPISTIAEFGVLCAVGIIGSFVTMTTFVPACKQLRDNRRLKKGKFAEIESRNNNSNNRKSKIKSAGVAVLDKTMGSGAVAAEHHPIPVVIIVSLITIGAVFTAIQLETTFNFEDFLPDDLDISKDLDYMMNEFGMSGGGDEKVNILVKGDITDPDILRDMDETINNMKDDKSVIKNADEPDVQSILSVMKDWATNTTLYGIQDTSYDPEFETIYYSIMTSDGIPNQDATKEDIANLYNWLYSNPLSITAVQYVLHQTENNDYDSTVLRISVNVDSNDNEAIETLHNDLKEDKKPLDSSADIAIATSGSILTKVIMDSLNESQIRSLIITIILSFIVLTIVFWYKWRSLILGIITMTPVIFCVAWTLGTMYLVNIPLNMMTITIASLTIGLGITYGIHITHRFLEDLENNNLKNNLLIQKKVQCPNCGKIISVSGKPGEVVKVTCPSCATLGKVTYKKPTSTTAYIDDACRSTVTHTGTALFGAAATTISGFGLLVFATMPPLQQFGGITALTILYSFLASVFILPTFLVVWAKWKQKNNRINF